VDEGTSAFFKGAVVKILAHSMGSSAAADGYIHEACQANPKIDLSPLYAAFAQATKTLITVSLVQFEVCVDTSANDTPPLDDDLEVKDHVCVPRCNEQQLLLKTQLSCQADFPGSGLRLFFHPQDFMLTIAENWGMGRRDLTTASEWGPSGEESSNSFEMSSKTGLGVVICCYRPKQFFTIWEQLHRLLFGMLGLLFIISSIRALLPSCLILSWRTWRPIRPS
jgi:hypothetical protein